MLRGNHMRELIPPIEEMEEEEEEQEKEEDDINEDTAMFRTAEQVKVFIMKSQKTYATALFILVGLSIGLAIAGIQVTYKEKFYQKRKFNLLNCTKKLDDSHWNTLNSTKENIFLYSNVKLGIESALSGVSLATAFSLYHYYRTVFLLKKVRHEFSKDILFINARPLFTKFLVEIVLCVLHLPPILSTYVNPKFQLLVFIRIYLIGRYLQQKHSLMHSQSTRCLARLGNTKLTSLFLVKASFRKYPFQMMVFGYTSFLLISTYMVWLLEETHSYFNTMWMLIIAMTTVGFGDLTPQTTLGRLSVTATSLVGILFIAIFCFLASQALTLHRKEKRVLAYYESKERVRQKKIAALNAIGNWYQYYAFKHQHFPNERLEKPNVGHGGAIKRGSRQIKEDNIFSLKKIKLNSLKTQMFKGITNWRAMRNDPEGPTFNPDFVLEDMKILVSNMSRNVDELMERPIDQLFQSQVDDSDSSCDECENEENIEIEDEEEPIQSTNHYQYHPNDMNQSQHQYQYQPNNISQSHAYYASRDQHPEVYMNSTSTTYDNLAARNGSYTARNNIFSTVRDNLPNDTERCNLPNTGYDNPNIARNGFQNTSGYNLPKTSRGNLPNSYQPKYNSSGSNGRHERTFGADSVKILEELLSDVPRGLYDYSQRDKNILVAFNLMKIQHNILNNAIETIYHKTKIDVADIQKRVASFMPPQKGNCMNMYETGF